ncbi:hypothetical protein GCM10010371_53360 [Streptomyces subrutilus]|uniref:Ferredoxin n=1 Tax=Streptomyces subrutilus TaxID=36818 RepID=A0A5P2UCV9_9ACTN|nr:ferredoxin [Streptomyces subrutilus]QEU77116.1 ferredoxin [Streptomyces subrutilus]GGZ86701.1 hypothetical protein GCM10010371_53360 [Streptomyces subrutilus]
MPRDDEPRTAREEGPRAGRRVHVDPALCIGSGICLATAPRHFQAGEDHRSRARPDAPAADESAEDATALCPVEAIGLIAGPPVPGIPPPDL